MYETGKIIGNKSPESIQEVMIIGQQYIKAASSIRSKNYDENDEDIIKKYEADMNKMTSAEFLIVKQIYIRLNLIIVKKNNSLVQILNMLDII